MSDTTPPNPRREAIPRDEVIAMARSLIPQIAERLELYPRWEIVVSDDPLNHEGRAEVMFNPAWQKATIYIHDPWPESRQRLVESLIHECVHLLLAPYEMAKGASQDLLGGPESPSGIASTGLHDYVNEHLTQQLTRVLLRLMPVGLWARDDLLGPKGETGPIGVAGMDPYSTPILRQLHEKGLL